MDNGSQAETEAYFREMLRRLCLEYGEIPLVRLAAMLEERARSLRNAEAERTQ